MGEKNSSVTRAWPVFGALLDRDSTGRTWLPQLIELCDNPIYRDAGPSRDVGTLLPETSGFGRKVPRNFKSMLEVDESARLRNCFEAELPPTHSFLAWLIANAPKLKKPAQKSQTQRKRSKRAEKTEQKRASLLSGDSGTAEQAQAELTEHGPAKSRRKWWAFEGFTCVDVLLETETTVIVVECKRNESLSPRVMWYEGRDQLGRNLEVAAAYATAKGKDFGVIVASLENVIPSKATLDASLPHLSPEERQTLYRHYWGNVRWDVIQDRLCDTSLPNTVSEAMASGIKYAVRVL